MLICTKWQKYTSAYHWQTKTILVACNDVKILESCKILSSFKIAYIQVIILKEEWICCERNTKLNNHIFRGILPNTVDTEVLKRNENISILTSILFNNFFLLYNYFIQIQFYICFHNLMSCPNQTGFQE